MGRLCSMILFNIDYLLVCDPFYLYIIHFKVVILFISMYILCNTKQTFCINLALFLWGRTFWVRSQTETGLWWQRWIWRISLVPLLSFFQVARYHSRVIHWHQSEVEDSELSTWICPGKGGELRGRRPRRFAWIYLVIFIKWNSGYFWNCLKRLSRERQH